MSHDLGCPTATSMQDYGLAKRVSLISRYINVKNKKILDVGCGYGFYSLKLADLGAKEVVGIDIEEQNLKKAQESITNYKNVKFYRYSAQELPFRDAYFDVILLIDVLEHISHPEIALTELNRVLKKNGNVVLFVPNKLWLYDQHGIAIGNKVISRPLLFSWAPDFIRKKFESAPVFTKGKMARLLRNAGFSMTSVDYMYPPFDKIKSVKLKMFLRSLAFLLEKYFKKFGHSIFVIGKKNEI